VHELNERRQFDFWVGEWDCTWDGGRGTNVVTSELDGTVIFERFDGRPGTELRGMSVSVFDAGRGVWRQTWVDSSGGYIDLSGGFANGVMELRHDNDTPFRMLFTELATDSLVWRWERWNQDTRAWDERWRIDYARRA
jgi:hypothetical protein